MSDENAQLLAKQFGEGYQILGLVSTHPSSILYRLRDDSIDKTFTVRFFSLKINAPAEAHERFDQFAPRFSAVTHPKIQPVLSAGNSTDGPYVILPDVDGEPLSSILNTNERLLPASAIEIALSISGSLKYVHELGIFHGNIAPANLIVQFLKHRWLLTSVVGFEIEPFISDPNDFNPQSARDYFYISPEQCNGDPIDQRSDIYSLGCLLYHMLTGRPPFSSTSAATVLLKHTRDKPLPFNEVWKDGRFPVGLQEIVFRCLEKNPKDRYQSLSALETDLRSVRAAEKVLPVWLTRHVAVIAAITLLIAGFVVGGIAVATNNTVEAIEQNVAFPIPSVYGVKPVFRSHSARTLSDAVQEAVSQNASLEGANLQGVSLSGLNLKGANLRNANISGLLIGTDLSGADLRGATLKRCKAMYSNFQGAQLQNSSIVQCNFAHANFQKVDLDEAYLTATNLTATKMEGTNLSMTQKHGVFTHVVHHDR